MADLLKENYFNFTFVKLYYYNIIEVLHRKLHDHYYYMFLHSFCLSTQVIATIRLDLLKDYLCKY